MIQSSITNIPLKHYWDKTGQQYYLAWKSQAQKEMSKKLLHSNCLNTHAVPGLFTDAFPHPATLPSLSALQLSLIGALQGHQALPAFF